MGASPWIDSEHLPDVRILAGWFLDGEGGPVREDMVLDISAGRVASIRPIRSVREVGERSAPSAPVLDCSGHTLLPALVDAHVHLFMSAVADPEIRRRQLDASFAELRPVMGAHLRALRESGIVAARDGGDYGGYALRLRDEPDAPGAPGSAGSPGSAEPQLGPGSSAADRDQSMARTRSGNRGRAFLLRAAGRAWRRDGRYGRLIGRPVPEGRTLAEAIRDDPDPADHVKLVHSGVNSLTVFGRRTPPQFSPEELRAGVRAAHGRGRPVMVHANGEAPVRSAVEAGCDSIEHGFFMGADNLSRMADRGTVWVPTAITMRAYAETLPPGTPEADIARRIFERQREQIARGRELGVEIAAGTDAGSLGVFHGPALAREMAILVEAGFSLAEAVRCATRNGARLLGRPDPGRIVPGAPARFLAVEGGPETLLANLEAKRFVWKGIEDFSTSSH